MLTVTESLPLVLITWGNISTYESIFGDERRNWTLLHDNCLRVYLTSGAKVGGDFGNRFPIVL